VPLFEGLPDDIVVRICLELHEQPILSGDTITVEGERADGMYFLLEGEVKVTAHGGFELGFLQPGSFFGELEIMGHGGGQRGDLR